MLFSTERLNTVPSSLRGMVERRTGLTGTAKVVLMVVPEFAAAVLALIGKCRLKIFHIAK